MRGICYHDPGSYAPVDIKLHCVYRNEGNDGSNWVNDFRLPLKMYGELGREGKFSILYRLLN